MATEYTLRRANQQPFGSFDQTQALIRGHFPTIEFGWTTSGPEKLKLAAQRGVTFPPQFLTILEKLPSLLEGNAEGEGWDIMFGLGHEEPVPCLYVTPRGDSEALDRGLRALEEYAGSEFKVHGEE